MPAEHTTNLTQHPAETGHWIAPFGERFIGLDETATIRRVIGSFNISPPSDTDRLPGLSWREFVTHFAAADAQEGLLSLWAAVAEGRVAPDFWPAAVPFAPGTIARLRRVTNHPIIHYAAHIQPALQCDLDTLIGAQTPDATQRLIQLSQSVSRGAHGPLTDSQVKAINMIVTLSEALDQLLSDLRTALVTPAVQAPLPHAVNTLFAFGKQEFTTIQRIGTQQLNLVSDLPDGVRVYCHYTVRDVVREILQQLFEGIEAQSAIRITCHSDSADTVQIAIMYSARTPSLSSMEPVRPLDLGTPERFRASNAVQRLVTAAQAHVRPVNGQVQATPVTGDDAHNMQVAITLPRWKENQM